MRRTLQVLPGLGPMFAIRVSLLCLTVVAAILFGTVDRVLAQDDLADAPPWPGTSEPKSLGFLVHESSPGNAAAASREGNGGDGAGRPLGVLPIRNVFLFIIDGLRITESFESGDHKLIPNIWNKLAPLGCIYKDFYNLGYTQTTAAHATITSGVSQTMALTYTNGLDLRRIQEEPSFLQVYRARYNLPKEEVWLINGKANMIQYVGRSMHPLYDASSEPTVAFVDKWPIDDVTGAVAEMVIDTCHPSLTVVNFKDVDGMGHTGDWNLYTAAIKSADRIVYGLCEKIWQDPRYEGTTAVIIVADHGRHSPGLFSDFKSHGCSCMGCRELPFLAIGPGIKKNTVIEKEGHLRDIAPTIGAMLGFSCKFSEGRVLREIFDLPLPEVPPEMTRPAIACGGGKVHAVFTQVDGADSHIVYTCSGDNGATWTNTQIVSTSPININPRVTADGNRVALSWSSYTQEGYLLVTVCESRDGGATWSKPVRFAGNFEFKGSYASDLSYRQGAIDVIWEEPVPNTSFKKSTLGAVTIRESKVVGSETFMDTRMRHTRCASTAAGTGAVYQKLNFLNKSWDIYFCLYDGTTWLAPVQLSGTAEESIHPDVVADDSGFHVVWAERHNGIFCIMGCNSADGIVWDTPGIIAEDLLGAWRPQIAAGTGMLAVVWEAYNLENPALYGAMSTNQGLTWSSPKRISGGDFEQRPATALDPQNFLHTIYQKGWAPARVKYVNLQL